MNRIKQLSALEILDSRARPTLFARCLLADGSEAGASVPSGASTGAAEARELRDRDPNRYRGMGCLTAVRHINEVINDALSGREFADQAALDRALCELDGSANKARLGANALLAVSLAYARAAARAAGLPLYAYFASLLGTPASRLPRPTINLFSGGKHAGGQVPLQDLLIVPAAADLSSALAMAAEVYQCAAELGLQKYQARPLTADEGGLAPPFAATEAMFEDALTAIERAGCTPGRDVYLALDVAASRFYQQQAYQFEGRALAAEQQIELLLQWLQRYRIVSLEDGLAEDDWAHWPTLCAQTGARALVLGDDLLCTNPQRIERAIATQAANALLLKVNQIGTLSEALEAYRLARAAGWQVTISARSGETEDDWLADLAVGWGGDQIKIGSLTQSERLAKYNRLLMIAAETGFAINRWPGSTC